MVLLILNMAAAILLWPVQSAISAYAKSRLFSFVYDLRDKGAIDDTVLLERFGGKIKPGSMDSVSDFFLGNSMEFSRIAAAIASFVFLANAVFLWWSLKKMQRANTDPAVL